MGTQNDSHQCWCHYLPGFVLVRPGREEEAIEQTGGSALENGELCRVLDGLDHEIVAQIQERVGVIHLPGNGDQGDVDPHDVSRDLNEKGIDASPVHGVGYLGHGGFMGSVWSDANVVLDPVDDADPKEGVIAVVDSGISPDLPGWMDDPNVIFERPIDTEKPALKGPVSHGTFVTSLIRRIAPQYQVSLASARPDPGYLDSNEPFHPPAHKINSAPSDELNVLGAVLRLIRRHERDGATMRALNLSLGAYACAGDGGQFQLSLEAALDAWRKSCGDAPVFAAGGNSTCGQPVYPAAFEGVHAVAAARQARKGDDGGVIKVWHNHQEVDPPQPRDWITDVGPGCDIIGLSGESDDHTKKWSGSSFATAIVTACHTDGAYAPDSDEGKHWWPARDVTYADVSRLVP